MINNFLFEGCSFDKNQLEILNCDTNLIVIAGAGSGKTLTILGKIKYLIDYCHYKEEEIAVISFTNASVNDIKNRTKYDINVFTFHKLAIHIFEKCNYSYNICSQNLLIYIIDEYLKTCPLDEQKKILKFLKLNISYQAFIKTNKYKCFCNFICTTINLLKTNSIINKDILSKKINKLDKKILLIILKIYQLYINEKNGTNSLDFDDLIIYATKLVKNACLNYKYIIIDEFQDTSLIRLNLIKEIFIYTNSKIIVVGDDYQSIYRFSGCDLHIFLNFDKYFPNVKKIILSSTYRNSNQLISIATKFIEKNPIQIKKDLKSTKNNNNPLIFVPYTNNKIAILKKLLDNILLYSSDIMILSRNNNDIYKYIDNNFIIDNNTILYNTKQLKYYTIHKSKGLQAEYVIVLNCDNNYLGFPNKIENHPLIEKLLPDNEIKYAEERRLFYVAITRCKETTFLLYNKNNSSIFIKEIKKIVKKKLKSVKYFN